MRYGTHLMERREGVTSPAVASRSSALFDRGTPSYMNRSLSQCVRVDVVVQKRRRLKSWPTTVIGCRICTCELAKRAMKNRTFWNESSAASSVVVTRVEHVRKLEKAHRARETRVRLQFTLGHRAERRSVVPDLGR
jgi:hypothetical protein